MRLNNLAKKEYRLQHKKQRVHRLVGTCCSIYVTVSKISLSEEEQAGSCYILYANQCLSCCLVKPPRMKLNVFPVSVFHCHLIMFSCVINMIQHFIPRTQSILQKQVIIIPNFSMRVVICRHSCAIQEILEIILEIIKLFMYGYGLESSKQSKN